MPNSPTSLQPTHFQNVSPSGSSPNFSHSGNLPALASPTTMHVATTSAGGYRSKFAGMPGSASALHIHYGFKNTAPAFDPLPPNSNAAVSKREARRWAQGARLGQKPEWDTTTGMDDNGGHPRRALMHQLSEFQAPKVVMNFRAQEVPTVHKKAVTVWKPNKFKVDQTSFLSKDDRAKATHQVLGNTNILSHAEIPVTENSKMQRREGEWNQSTALASERENIFAKKEYPDFRPLNKTKGILDHDRYVTPVEDVRRRHDKQREEKRTHRKQQEEFVTKMKREARMRRGLRPVSLAAEGGGDGQVFKMSNIDQWWNAAPPELEEAVSVIEARRFAEEERVKKQQAEEDARMTGQPSGIRVVAPGGQGSSAPTSGR